MWFGIIIQHYIKRIWHAPKVMENEISLKTYTPTILIILWQNSGSLFNPSLP